MDVSSSSECKLYKIRWIVLVVFMIYSMNGSCQCVQFSVINDIVCEYYGVSSVAVEWTTLSFLLCFIIFIAPSVYIMDTYGVKFTMMLSCTGITIGAWIKVLATAPDKFWLLFIGQVFEAIFTILTYCLAAKITSIWFGAKEISFAGSLALLGDQVGGVMGFLLPPLIVKNSGIKEVVGGGLLTLNLIVAGMSTITFILVVFLFKEKPPIPPSRAQIEQNKIKEKDVWTSFKKLMRIRGYILMLLSFGFFVGTSTTLTTFLNFNFVSNFSNDQFTHELVGKIGATIITAGMIGSLVNGYVLDKTRLFKENVVYLTGASFVSLLLFFILLDLHLVLLIYMAAALFGIVACGFYTTAVQTCIELSFPVSEGISSSVMATFAQIVALIASSIYSILIKRYVTIIGNIFLLSVLFLSFVSAVLIPKDLKRQEIENANKVRRISEVTVSIPIKILTESI